MCIPLLPIRATCPADLIFLDLIILIILGLTWVNRWRMESWNDYDLFWSISPAFAIDKLQRG
jgi:hypothetical protein